MGLLKSIFIASAALYPLVISQQIPNFQVLCYGFSNPSGGYHINILYKNIQQISLRTICNDFSKELHTQNYRYCSPGNVGCNTDGNVVAIGASTGSNSALACVPLAFANALRAPIKGNDCIDIPLSNIKSRRIGEKIEARNGPPQIGSQFKLLNGLTLTLLATQRIEPWGVWLTPRLGNDFYNIMVPALATTLKNKANDIIKNGGPNLVSLFVTKYDNTPYLVSIFVDFWGVDGGFGQADFVELISGLAEWIESNQSAVGTDFVFSIRELVGITMSMQVTNNYN